VHAGRLPSNRERRQRRIFDTDAARLFTLNDAFDTVARHWSDHYRATREAGRAFRVRDMKMSTAFDVRRDLLLNDIRLSNFWALLITHDWNRPGGGNPLYAANKHNLGRRTAYAIKLAMSATLDEFERIVCADPHYRPPRQRGLRVRRAGSTPDRQRPRDRICGERPYNIVTLGARSERLLSQLAGVRVALDVAALGHDLRGHRMALRTCGGRVTRNMGFDLTEPHWRFYELLRLRIIDQFWVLLQKEMELPPDDQLSPADLTGVLTDALTRSTWHFTEQSAAEAAGDLIRERAEAAGDRAREEALAYFARADEEADAIGASRAGLDLPHVFKIVAREVGRPVRWAYRRFCASRDFIDTWSGITGQLGSVTADSVEIETTVTRNINRRWQAMSFWPTETTTEDSRDRFIIDLKDLEDIQNIERPVSARGGWFRWPERSGSGLAQLDGVDISGSQVQIIAVLVGNTELERLACSEDTPWKRYLAETAWEMFNDGRLRLRSDYTSPNDLVPLVKETFMRVVYGSRLHQIVRDAEEPSSGLAFGWLPPVGDDDDIARSRTLRDKHGDAPAVCHKAHQKTHAVANCRACAKLRADGKPRWRQEYRKARSKIGVENVETFLHAIPGYGDLQKFLDACREIADVADKYVGVELIDPFDDAGFRWNRPKRRRQRLRIDGKDTVVIDAPVYSAADPQRYEVDRMKLRQQVAPMLVHMLDAAFSGAVMEALFQRGVKDLISAHDFWAIPAASRDAAEAALREVFTQVTPAWFRSLDVVYQRLDYYLGAGQYGGFVRRMRERWAERCAEAEGDPSRWPQFAATISPATKGT
jgi:hypothetical protein